MTDFALAPETPPSPFLPGTNIQYAWDSTSIGYLKTCPRLYQYTMIDGWSSKEESIHLRFGAEYHQALQDYDLSRAAGIPHNDAVFDVIRELLIRIADWSPDTDSKAGKYKNKDSLLRTVIWYLDDARQNDNYKTYIMANGKPAVELSFRFELAFGPEAGAGTKCNSMKSSEGSGSKQIPCDGVCKNGVRELGCDEPCNFVMHPETGDPIEAQPYLLCGHLDRVCSDGSDLYIEDHKTTTSTLGDYFFNQFEPNNQMSLYTFGGQMVLETTIKGIIINGVQLMVDSTRFVRGFTFRTPDQIEEWVTDLSRWLALAEWYAENNYWPQNDTACDKFGGCRFRSVCSKSPNVREIYLKSAFNKLEPEERWNPLRSR